MKFYFLTRHLPGLEHLSLQQRLAKIQAAHKHLSGPEKLLLNVVKLLIIIPLFVVILRTSDNWWALLWALLITLAYPIILKPLHHGLCAKYLVKSDQKGA